MTLDHRSCLFWYLIKLILISSKKNILELGNIIASTGKKVSKKHPEYYYYH